MTVTNPRFEKGCNTDVWLLPNQVQAETRVITEQMLGDLVHAAASNFGLCEAGVRQFCESIELNMKPVATDITLTTPPIRFTADIPFGVDISDFDLSSLDRCVRGAIEEWLHNHEVDNVDFTLTSPDFTIDNA